MPKYDLGQADTQAIDVSAVTVPAVALEGPESTDKEQGFPDAATNFGYYKSEGALNSAISSLATWTVGKGYETEDDETGIMLEHLTGWGEDSATSLFWNMIVTKKIVGDAFAEIIRNDSGTLVNLKPISPERMKIVIAPNGLIKHYIQMRTGQDDLTLPPEKVFHICNDRIGDETHGNSVLETCKWVVDALKEAREDYRKVLHRNVVPLRIIEVDTENATKRNRIMAEYKTAIEQGEVLVVPKGTVEIKNEQIAIQDPIAWINSLENYFYIAVKVPRVIATSEGTTEAGGKVGFLTFEPVYTFEQTLFEQDLWNQLSIRVKFNRPPTLGGMMQEDEAANTGQTGIQPQDTEATITQE